MAQLSLCHSYLRGTFINRINHLANLEKIVNNTSKIVLDSKDMDRALTRIAHEIIERNKGIEDLALIGIRTGGVPLSERLQQRIAAIEGTMVSTGILDITLYRDDWSTLSQHPIVRKTDISFSVDNKNIILVDDVLYTGRTIRAALDALTDLGRPRKIQLAVLVDRGRRELPIKPDFVGLSLQTSANEHVNVFLNEIARRDEVVLEEKAGQDI
ncbi:MAG: bifunctional pyr operon transcriptional regulator/uracil phosphoribosyltransferase PyrR [Deltaproteobacteria bacterium]|nr:MAG: bifunctional pyr operon transcriptional regulator/uracil phosphoribosyltransferase PyrR [Deltaproteobacteria bacterium]